MITDRRLVTALRVRLARLDKLLAEANRVRTLLSDKNINLLNRVHKLEKANRRVHLECDTAQRDLALNEIRIRSRVKAHKRLSEYNHRLSSENRKLRTLEMLAKRRLQHTSMLLNDREKLTKENIRLTRENDALAAVACQMAVGDERSHVVCAFDHGKPGQDYGFWEVFDIKTMFWPSPVRFCCLCGISWRYLSETIQACEICVCPDCDKKGE